MKITKQLLAAFCLLLVCAAPSPAQQAQDAGAILAEGWRLFNLGSYREAEESFQRAWASEPLRDQAGQGMAYSLLKREKLDEALAVVEKFPADHKVFGPMRRDILSQKAMGAFNAKNYPEAEKGFRKLLDMGEKDVSLKTLLGWALFHQGKKREAAPVFAKAYQQSGDPKAAEAALLAYGASGDLDGGAAFARSLAATGDPMISKRGGLFIYDHGMPITAAQMDSAPVRPYANADKPRIQVEGIYRAKTGDAGLSKLTDISIPITYSHPFETGNELSISMIPITLDSGGSPSTPMAGSYFSKDSAAVRRINTKVNAVAPQITYRADGEIRYTLQAGATPISGAIGAAPTFRAKANGGWFNVSAFQAPVTESILSYTGLADPYGTKSWGRVLRTGAGAEFIFSFMGPHWFSIGAGYNKYAGQDVVDNNDVNATSSVGRAFATENWDIAAGLFGYMAKFDKNSNFFTYGHGGYFSPQNFTLGGLMLSMESKPVEDYWAEIKLSASYMKFKNEASAKYPLSADPAMKSETFPADEVSQMGYAVQGRVYRLLAQNWLVGAGAAFSKASAYTETILQVTLRYQFGARKAVLFVKD